MGILNRRHAIAKIPTLALAARGADGPGIGPRPNPILDVPDDVRLAAHEVADAWHRVGERMAWIEAVDWDGMSKEERWEHEQRQDQMTNEIVGLACRAGDVLSEALARYGAVACIVDGMFIYDHCAVEKETEFAEDQSPFMPILDARRVLGSMANPTGEPVRVPVPVVKHVHTPEFALSDREKDLVRLARDLGERETWDRMLLCGRYQFAWDHISGHRPLD